MKFGKRLKQHMEETLPGWEDKYLKYKDLKRLVRLVASAAPALVSNRGSFEFGKAEEEFVVLLNNEIDKFNAFFMEQEEDFIIRHKELQQRIQRVIEEARTPLELDHNEEMREIRRDIVDFHGEMVLLINYSNINYTGLAKILKKYDKRTGGLLRLLFIQKVLQEPFFTTDLISKLIRECETAIDILFPAAVVAEIGRRDTSLAIAGSGGIFRNTVAALVTMQEIRRESSTYGHFSLPPLNFPDSDHIIQSLQLVSPIPILIPIP